MICTGQWRDILASMVSDEVELGVLFWMSLIPYTRTHAHTYTHGHHDGGRDMVK